MGTYINIGNAGFQSARNGEYVDKSQLIAVVNKTLFTKLRFSCITRCRRFGKSMAAEMLCAYYSHSCNSRSLFADLEIANAPSFEMHLNKYPVIYLDMSDFVTRFKDDTIVKRMEAELMEDIHKAYSDIHIEKGDDLMSYLIRVEEATQQPTGKGFADIVLIPRKNVVSPAIVLELKYNKDADSAIDQILRKQYPEKIAQYHGDLLLVGINYDKKEKTHQCKITSIKN
jgi:hypothetical protein